MRTETRFVSSNPHKLAEAEAILGPHGIRVIPSNLKIEELQTTDTQRLVRDKLLNAYEQIGRPLFVEHKEAMSSYYRDPYLSAIRQESGVEDTVVQGSVGHHWSGGPWFTGYETEPRWMRLKASGTEVQCVQDGLLLRPPKY